MFGHGTHTIQGVELYKGKPILYAIGHSAFDQPGYEDSKDGLVIRAVIHGRQLLRVSFVPVPTCYDVPVPSHFRSLRDSVRIVGTLWRFNTGMAY